MSYFIRPKKIEDCLSCAKVAILSWNETYRGIVDDLFLDEILLKEEETAQKERDSFFDDTSKYVLEVDGKVVGFINFGRAHTVGYDGYGEIYSFYILKKYHGFGYGKEMFLYALQELRKDYSKVIVGCLKDNPTTKFYEHMGGRIVQTHQRPTGNSILEENIYEL